MTRYRVDGEFLYQAIRLPGESLLVAKTADECKDAAFHAKRGK